MATKPLPAKLFHVNPKCKAALELFLIINPYGDYIQVEIFEGIESRRIIRNTNEKITFRIKQQLYAWFMYLYELLTYLRLKNLRPSVFFASYYFILEDENDKFVHPILFNDREKYRYIIEYFLKVI